MSYHEMDVYESLYAKYLEKPVSEMIDVAGNVEGKVVWDLCCGGGAIAHECCVRGASRVVAVDESWEMMRKSCYTPTRSIDITLPLKFS